jgi:hypothetical protein
MLMRGTFLVSLIWRRWVTLVRPMLVAEMDKEGCAEHEDYLGLLLDVKVGGVGGDDANTSCQVPGQNRGNGLLTTHDSIAAGKQRKRECELNSTRRKQSTLLSVC